MKAGRVGLAGEASGVGAPPRAPPEELELLDEEEEDELDDDELDDELLDEELLDEELDELAAGAPASATSSESVAPQAEMNRAAAAHISKDRADGFRLSGVVCMAFFLKTKRNGTGTKPGRRPFPGRVVGAATRHGPRLDRQLYRFSKTIQSSLGS